MRFYVVPEIEPLRGKLTYSYDEYSFDFECRSQVELRHRAGHMGETSIAIGTLQIEVGIETGLLLYVWGYHPHTSWTEGAVAHPKSLTAGGLRVELETPLLPGVSVGLNGDTEWTTIFDPATGWIRMGVGTSDGPLVVEIADGVIAVLRNDKLEALRLRPSGFEVG
jgi:hypothetical protein